MKEHGNPYLPPKAIVADVSNEAPMVRPRSVSLALILIGARWMLGLGFALGTLPDLGASNLGFAFSGAAFATLMTAALFWFIAQGRNWARIVYLVLTLIALLQLSFAVFGMRYVPEGVELRSGGFPYEWLATRVLPPLISLAAVVLLFGPGRAWFRPRS